MTMQIDEIDPFDFDLKATEKEEALGSVTLENATIAAVRTESLNQSADTFNFTDTPDDGSAEGWGIPWREITEFIIETLPDEKPGPTPNPDPWGDEMPEDLPAGLVVHQEFDLML